jgi:hypothetical protein
VNPGFETWQRKPWRVQELGETRQKTGGGGDGESRRGRWRVARDIAITTTSVRR